MTGYNTTQNQKIASRAIISALALLTVFSGVAAAEQLYVNEGGWWRVDGAFNASETPISAAVGAAAAGDSIYVYGGNYYENVDVNKPRLTLEGEGADVVTVTAKSSRDHVFEVTGAWVNISGFNVAGTESPKAGIYLGSGIGHCNISDNSISNNWHGIYLDSSSSNTLINNTASDNNYKGIYLYSSSNNMLINNTANSNDWYGIYLGYSSNNTLTNNTANSNYNVYQGFANGICIGHSSDNTLTNNNASNNEYTGILLGPSSNNTLTDNIINANDWYGICLGYSSNNTLRKNTANSNNRDGISLWSSSDNNTLTNNTANLNSNYGICLAGSNSSMLEGNTVNLNDYYGIYLGSSSNNNITCNWMQNNTKAGFCLRGGSRDNNISYNNIIENGEFGIYLHSSSYNLIYNNYFNNTNNAWDNGNNIWNVTKQTGTNIIRGSYIGGNYWGDYAGADLDGYGLGNTLIPYNSSGNIVHGGDYLPLVQTSAANLTCTCGDICVNENGWWRDGGVFNASETPIQSAVNAADSGDSIFVWNGCYTENVNVNKQIMLESEGTDVVTVTAAFSGDHVFEVTANWTTISGFTVTGATSAAKAGICLSGVDHCNISENNVLNNYFGICLSSSSDNMLTNNTANSNYHGINLSSSINNTLTMNTASNNYRGIYLHSSSHNLIYNNYFNNTNNAWDNGNNTWNVTKQTGTNIIGGSHLGGNYWSDYAGADSDRDGLGDALIPYNSSGNITNGGDYLPLHHTCTCGDICVNENGWWRDGDVFNASGTPIKVAVDNATAGDTIFVYNGSYTENVNVNKRLTLEGEGTDVVTVTAADAWWGNVFAVTADGVNITGFTLTGNYGGWPYPEGAAGIYLSSADHCNISGNNVSNNERGIYLYQSSNNMLTNNTMSGNRWNFGVSGSNLSHYIQNIDTSNTVDGKPIYYWVDQRDMQIPSDAGFVGVVNSTNITVRDMTLTKNGEGVLFAYTGNSRIENITANSNSNRGIYLYSSSNNTLEQNNCSSSQDGIYLYYSSNNTLKKNSCSNNGGGIYLWHSSNYNTLTNNIANSNSNDGIYLYSSSNNTLEKNNCSNSGNGIRLYSSNNNTLTNDIANSNYYGIGLHSSSSNTLQNNTANSNSCGIHLYSSSNNTLEKNNCLNNGGGIRLSSSGSNTLQNNTANSNHCGIHLSSSSSNTLQDNTAKSNSRGIYLSSSGSNMLMSNTANSNSYLGIYLHYWSNYNTLTYNTANSNNRGIYLSDSSSNNITCNQVQNNTRGIYLHSGSLNNNINYNNIIENGNYNATGSSWEWQFYNYQSNPVEAKRNYWGAGMNNSTIDASIYDDEEGQGEVRFYPFETEPVPCAPTPDEPPAFTTADAVIALQIAVGSRPPDLRWDVSGDKRVTSLDALMILQAAAGDLIL